MTVGLWVLIAAVPLAIVATIALIAIVAHASRRSSASQPTASQPADTARERDRLAAQAAAQRAVAQGTAGQQGRSNNHLF